MKTFEDLVFEPHPNRDIDASSKLAEHAMSSSCEFLYKMVTDHYSDAAQSRLMFNNGYGVSVITGKIFYTDDAHPYELAVLNSKGIDYDHPESHGDVRGHLTADDVIEIMRIVQETGVSE